MLKRVMSSALVLVMISTLGFASFGDTVKKSISDDEIAEGIKIEQPAIKTVKSENLTISGTITTPQGINVNMTLQRLDGKELVDSAESLNSVTIPKFLLEEDFNNDKEKAIVKKFAKAYEERVKAGLEYEKVSDAYDKAKKENKSAAKIKELKEDLDKEYKNLRSALEEYQDASSNYIELTQETIFSEITVGGKLPGFSKTVKDIQPGYYNLVFKRSDNDRVVKTLEFEVQWSGNLIKGLEMPSMIQTNDGAKK